MNTHAFFVGSLSRIILFDFTARAEELALNIACLVPSFNNRTVQESKWEFFNYSTFDNKYCF